MRRKCPGGPRLNLPLVIVGQMLSQWFPFDPWAFGVGVARQFGDIAHYRIGPRRVYQLSHPDLARQVLIEQPEKFYKPRLVKRALRPFAGDGLVTSDGALWKQQRKPLPSTRSQGCGPGWSSGRESNGRSYCEGTLAGVRKR